jgi:hypothetical protein
VPDWSEFVAGTDPLDARSVFLIDQLSFDASSQTFSASWPSATNRLYTVWSTTNLSGNWLPLNDYANLPGTGTRLGFTGPATGQRYFRLEVSR